MCLSPVLVKNTNKNILSKNIDLSYVSDTSSTFIYVPCGHCPVCNALRQQYLAQRVQMESLDNVIMFGTLTYNKTTLPSLNVNGFNIKYADVRHFQDMVRLIRKDKVLNPFRYFAVSEFGGKKHRPHWHFMIFYDKKYISDYPDRLNHWQLDALQGQVWPVFLKYWRHNVGSRKFPDWKPNCDYFQRGFKRNYDLSVVDTITEDCSDSAFYITKYSTKFSDYVDRLHSAIRLNTSESDFKEIWKKVKPHRLMSKGFGNPYSDKVREHIRNGIIHSLNDKDCFYPLYFSPYTGQSFPLSPYFRSKFLTADEALIFKERLLSASPTGIITDAEIGIPLTPDEIDKRFHEQKKIDSMISARDGYYSDCLDYLNKDDFNLSDLLLTDEHYGQVIKLNSEDFATPDDWEDTLGDNCDACSDNISLF